MPRQADGFWKAHFRSRSLNPRPRRPAERPVPSPCAMPSPFLGRVGEPGAAGGGSAFYLLCGLKRVPLFKIVNGELASWVIKQSTKTAARKRRLTEYPGGGQTGSPRQVCAAWGKAATLCKSFFILRSYRYDPWTRGRNLGKKVQVIRCVLEGL